MQLNAHGVLDATAFWEERAYVGHFLLCLEKAWLSKKIEPVNSDSLASNFDIRYNCFFINMMKLFQKKMLR